jgi:hypothetical protein
MATPILDPAPGDPELRKLIVAGSSDEQLERIRQFVLSRMHALSHETKPAHGDYAIWDAFVREIETEQRKRALS